MGSWVRLTISCRMHLGGSSHCAFAHLNPANWWIKLVRSSEASSPHSRSSSRLNATRRQFGVRRLQDAAPPLLQGQTSDVAILHPTSRIAAKGME